MPFFTVKSHGNLWIEADLGLAEEFRHLPGEIELEESQGSVVQFFLR